MSYDYHHGFHESGLHTAFCVMVVLCFPRLSRRTFSRYEAYECQAKVEA